MKKLLLISIATLSVLSCKKEPKDYVTLNGEVQNLTNNIDSVTVFVPNGYKKQIAIQSDGTFSDTLKVKEGKYQFKIGDEYGAIYLKNNDDIKIITDYKDFDSKLKFEGSGISTNISNVYIQNYQLSSDYLNDKTLNLPENKFDSVLLVYENSYKKFKEDNSKIQASVWEELDESYSRNLDGFKQYYKQTKEIKDKYTGKQSPEFAMNDINGNLVKLSDFRGKYVYIDVWATWCGPCKREIPALKDLEKTYHDKNIVFVSMSVDEAKDKGKWAEYVKNENLGGVQIFAENAWKSDFVQSYEIKSIPRFILLDPQGVIINPNAPRPSDKSLIKLFNDLNI